MNCNSETGALTVDELLSVPVGEQLCDHLLVIAGTTVGVAAMTDADFYRAICSAALNVTSSVGHYREAFRFSDDVHRTVAPLVVERLQSDTFAATPTSTQIWHGHSQYVVSRYKVPMNPPDQGFPSKPTEGLWTSSLLPTGESGWQPIVLSGYLGTPPPSVSCRWNIDISKIRIFRIETAAKWSELCYNFPRYTSHGVDLDWDGVAKKYDAIHLSPVGLIRTQDVRLQENLTPLHSWDAESTIWLRPPWQFQYHVT